MEKNKLELKSDPEVKAVYDNYPLQVRQKMLRLRELVLECAGELDEVDTLEETLKWSEPSYLAKDGSTLRMDWKPRSPDQYAMYFKCTSKLVESFREVYKDSFEYETNRAIVFKLNDEIPKEKLKQCIKATLAYHKRKHLPQLGLDPAD